MDKHYHCRQCGELIPKYSDNSIVFRVLSSEYNLECAVERLKICKSCLGQKGIEYYSKKNKGGEKWKT